MIFKMSSAKWWPICLGLNVLKNKGNLSKLSLRDESICNSALSTAVWLLPGCAEFEEGSFTKKEATTNGILWDSLYLLYAFF